MMKRNIYLLLLLPLLFPLPLLAQDIAISEEEMVALINSTFGKYTLYQSKDIPDKDLYSYDFNDDGVSELVVVPPSACRSTRNCTFFVMQLDKKKKKWSLMLMADGKVTNVTPWGFVPTSRKTKNYKDLILVFDMGPEANGTRALDPHIYTWDGKKYVEFLGPKYPPEGPTPEMATLLDQVDKLKFQKLVSGSPKKKKTTAVKKKGATPAEVIFDLPPEMQQ